MRKIFIVIVVGICLFLSSFYVCCGQSREPTTEGGQTSVSSIIDESSEESVPENDSSGNDNLPNESTDDPIQTTYYTVQFYDGDKLIVSQKVEKGGTFSKPQDLTDEFEEYEFVGWVKNGESEIYDFNSDGAMIACENIIFKAEWEKIEYTPWVK